MSPSIVILLASLATILVGERLVGSYPTARFALDILGVIGIVGVFIFRLAKKRTTTDNGLSNAHGRVVIFVGVALIGIATYAISTSGFIEMMGWSGEYALRWGGVFGALWPLIIFGSVVGVVIVDNAIVGSPITLPMRRVKLATNAALAGAFAMMLMFPLNYLANNHNTRWDLSYFKTANAGVGTKNIIANASSPIIIRAFQPPSSEIGIELQSYFEPLVGPNLKFELLDQPANPTLAQKLKVRDNGYIAISTEETGKTDDKEKTDVDPRQPIPSKRAQLIKIGTDIESAETRDKLRTLDKEIRKAMLAATRGKLIAYVSTGHGELSKAKQAVAPLSMKVLRRGLESLQFRVVELKPTGLLKAIPEDANLLLILGPTRGLQTAEVANIKTYLEGGGALFLATEEESNRSQGFVDPAVETPEKKMSATEDLLAYLGLERLPGTLTSKQANIPLTRTKLDRIHLATERVSAHPATNVLMKSEQGVAPIFLSNAGALAETKNGVAQPTVVLKSNASNWLDVDKNYEIAAEEKRQAYNVAYAVVGEDQPWRAIVTSDATMFSDLAFSPQLRNIGNSALTEGFVNWLVAEEQSGGAANEEKDTQVQQTKEGQALWFYLTVLGIPLLVAGFGAFHVRRRQRKGGQS